MGIASVQLLPPHLPFYSPRPQNSPNAGGQSAGHRAAVAGPRPPRPAQRLRQPRRQRAAQPARLDDGERLRRSSSGLGASCGGCVPRGDRAEISAVVKDLAVSNFDSCSSAAPLASAPLPPNPLLGVSQGELQRQRVMEQQRVREERLDAGINIVYLSRESCRSIPSSRTREPVPLM